MQRTQAILSPPWREEYVAKIALRYGICEQTLYRYRDQYLEGGKAGLATRVWPSFARATTASDRMGR